MSSDCCFKGFIWGQQPTGRETTFACGNKCYVTGTFDSDSSHDVAVAIMLIHDLFGWTFQNTRILADALAKEVGATVYVPDFFDGEVLSPEILSDYSRWHELDIAGVDERHSKSIRYPEILGCAKELRTRYRKFGTIGYCFGGWAAFRLGSESADGGVNGNNNSPLVDCITAVHPTWLTKEEIARVRVPLQILSPVHDVNFTSELKNFVHQTIPALDLPYDYQLFPGVEHGFAIRGDQTDEKEMRAMQRAKEAAVGWLKFWLRGDE